MILINLLPHREERRQRRKVAFFAGLGVAAAAGLAVVGVWYLVVQQLTSVQQQRNEFLTAEIKKLDEATSLKGYTLLALEVYLLHGKIKVLIGLGKGKKQFDKREDQKEKDAKLDMKRAMGR